MQVRDFGTPNQGGCRSGAMIAPPVLEPLWRKNNGLQENAKKTP
jgi:hypothetical protein